MGARMFSRMERCMYGRMGEYMHVKDGWMHT